MGLALGSRLAYLHRRMRRALSSQGAHTIYKILIAKMEVNDQRNGNVGTWSD